MGRTAEPKNCKRDLCLLILVPLTYIYKYKSIYICTNKYTCKLSCICMYNNKTIYIYIYVAHRMRKKQ